MAKIVAKQENIVEKRESGVPVAPSLNQFNLYGITPPSDFALYGRDNKALYNNEVQRVTNELRQEVFYNTDSTQLLNLAKEEVVVKKAKKVNAAAIIIFIVSALILALYVLGKYIVSPIPNVAGLLFVADKSGLGVIYDLINVFLKGSEIKVLIITRQIAIATIAVMSFVTILSSLFIMRRPGVGKAMKTALFLNFVFAVVVGVMMIVNKDTLPIGYYILFGLTFIAMVSGLFAKGVTKEKAKKTSRRKNG